MDSPQGIEDLVSREVFLVQEHEHGRFRQLPQAEERYPADDHDAEVPCGGGKKTQKTNKQGHRANGRKFGIRVRTNIANTRFFNSNKNKIKWLERARVIYNP